MLTIFDRGPRLCDGLSRRQWLRIGGMALGGLSLPQLLRARAAEPSHRPKAKSVILFFLTGGPPQMETWDPKPQAPAEIRGEVGEAIGSSLPGLRVGALMPRTAALAHKHAVLRAMVTHDNAHSSSGYQMMTGVPHQPLSQENAVAKAPNFAPHMGAIVRALRPDDDRLPSAICLPRRIANVGEIVWPGQTAGFLGRRYDPWIIPCDPSAEANPVPDLALPEDLPALRFDRRRTLLSQIEQHWQAVENSPDLARYDNHARQALNLLGAAKSSGAFDLEQ